MIISSFNYPYIFNICEIKLNKLYHYSFKFSKYLGINTELKFIGDVIGFQNMFETYEIRNTIYQEDY